MQRLSMVLALLVAASVALGCSGETTERDDTTGGDVLDAVGGEVSDVLVASDGSIGEDAVEVVPEVGLDDMVTALVITGEPTGDLPDEAVYLELADADGVTGVVTVSLMAKGLGEIMGIAVTMPVPVSLLEPVDGVPFDVLGGDAGTPVVAGSFSSTGDAFVYGGVLLRTYDDLYSSYMDGVLPQPTAAVGEPVRLADISLRVTDALVEAGTVTLAIPAHGLSVKDGAFAPRSPGIVGLALTVTTGEGGQP